MVDNYCRDTILFAVWVIKQAGQIIKGRNYRLVYWRYVIPMLLSCAVPIVILRYARDKNVAYTMSEQKAFVLIPAIIIFTLCCTMCFIRFGLRRGLSVFLIQSMCVLILVCFLYAAVVLFVIGIALMLGTEIAFGDKYVEAVAVDLSEIVYVMHSRNNVWVDWEGNIYYSNTDAHLMRQSDMKLFSLDKYR